MNLPIFYDWKLAVTQWKAKLDPFLGNVSNDASILENVQLGIGSNTINHKLGKKLTGWRIIRKRSNANIYDTQDTNTMPQLTLVLVSDAAVKIDLEVF